MKPVASEHGPESTDYVMPAWIDKVPIPENPVPQVCELSQEEVGMVSVIVSQREAHIHHQVL